MSKAKEYFKDCEGMTKEEAVEHVVSVYGIKRITAKNYWSIWQNNLKIENQRNKINDYLNKEPEQPVISYNVKDKDGGPTLGEGRHAVPIKKSEEELPIIEAIADPDAIIKAAKGLHEVNSEPIKEFTEEEKEEVAAIESAKAEEPESDELSMILKCKIFTYKIDKNGIEVIDGATDKVTQESVFEQQRALNLASMFNRYFLGGALI